MFSELRQVRNILMRVGFCFLFFAVVFFAVPTALINVRTVEILAPTASLEGKTVTERALEKIRDDLAPEGVQLVTSNPLDPFTTKATLAVVLSLLITIPYLLLEIFLFVVPALYPKERASLLWVLLLSCTLFFLGAWFAYSVIIPLIFTALFTYLPSDIAPFYNVRELIGLVVGLVFAVSLIFLLPVVMVMVSATGLIKPSFWREHARFAVLLVLLLSAIITPDGSGVSMVLLALPICLLYTVGYAGSAFVSRTTVPHNH